jgi:hypothetical protein
MKDFKELFVTKRDSIYADATEKNLAEGAFYNACMALKSVYTLPEPNDVILKSLIKNVVGYAGAGKQMGFFSGYSTPKALDLKNEEFTNDHVIGATKVGELVLAECIKSNWNIDLLIKEGWLHENLYLWGTIRVAKIEHKPSNILRNKNSLSEKIILEHYKTINIDDLVYLY